MGRQYDHLNSTERACIMLRVKDGWSSRAIARELQWAPSTVAREINRHERMPGCAQLPYEATRAAARAHLARFTRRRRRKLDVRSELFSHVRSELRRGLSPNQISGRLKREYANCYAWNVSHETIYAAL